MTGDYSIADVIDDSNKKSEKTVFCFLEDDPPESFSTVQSKSLRAVGQMVERNGGKWLKSLEEVAVYLNNKVW